MALSLKRQASDSFPGPLNEARAASTAGGGTALTTTAAFIALPDRSTHVTLITRNYATAAVVKFAFNPYLLLLRTDNGLGAVTDYSSVSQRNPSDATGISLNNLDVQANGGAIYIGAHVPFRGVAITNANANANASVLSVNFWNGTAWTATSGFTDGTTTGGKTMAQNGNVTWTVPTTWKTTQLFNTIPTNVAPFANETLFPYQERARYWMQWVVSAKLSATVSNSLMLSMNRVTTYAEAPTGTFTQGRVVKGVDGVANIEALTDAGTANLIVNAYTDNPYGIF